MKIARELTFSAKTVGKKLYVMDEPTTGLHLEDIRKLAAVLDRLVDAGHTVVLIEHNLDVIKLADWVIDMGPDGGDGGGKVVAMGSTPVIVTNTAQGFHAFSAVCTHLGCIVAFDSTLGQIGCPCHGGVFNASTGAVVSGPPPAPLKPVTVVVEKDQIFLVNS